MIADTFPRRRFHGLKVVPTELFAIKKGSESIYNTFSRPALTSLPFTTRESGSAFMSQYFGDIVPV
jgi:hypothetical protein